MTDNSDLIPNSSTIARAAADLAARAKSDNVTANVVSIEEVRAVYEKHLDKLDGLKAVLGFDFGDSRFFIDGKSSPAVIRDDMPQADCTVFVQTATLKDIIDGKLDGFTAFNTGKLRVKGDWKIGIKCGKLRS